LKKKVLTIKAKYNVIEPPYMEGTTPDGPVMYSGQLLKYVIVDYERKKVNLLKLINNKTILIMD
jgi:hypothetical protein